MQNLIANVIPPSTKFECTDLTKGCIQYVIVLAALAHMFSVSKVNYLIFVFYISDICDDIKCHL